MHPKSVQLAMQTAIQFGQLIKLITPLAQTSKALSKSLARLLSRVQSRVSIIANTNDETVARIESERMNAGYAMLRDGAKTHLCAEKLLRASVNYKHVYFSQVRMSARSQHELTLLVNRIAEDPITSVSLDPARDTQSRHLYASLVRNANWLPLIADLGAQLSVADKTLLNAELVKRHASHQGIALYSQRLALLAGAIEPHAEKKKNSGATRKTAAAKTATRTAAKAAPSVDAAGLYSHQVVLDLDKALAHPAVVSLFMHYPEVAGESALAEILEHAAKPFELGPDVPIERVAQALVDDLVSALHARALKIDKARKAEQAAREKQKEQNAVEALKKLDPALIKALKDNPALLQSL